VGVLSLHHETGGSDRRTGAGRRQRVAIRFIRPLRLALRSGWGVPKDGIEAYAFYNLAGIWVEHARKNREILEKRLSQEAVLRGQQRTKELQKEIEAKIAAKKDGK
jgi:hypothetical protein